MNSLSNFMPISNFNASDLTIEEVQSQSSQLQTMVDALSSRINQTGGSIGQRLSLDLMTRLVVVLNNRVNYMQLQQN